MILDLLPDWLLPLGGVLIYILGALSAVDAVMKGRTSQGSVAWVLALLTVPLVSLVLYWVFGRTKFDGYVETLKSMPARAQLDGLADAMRAAAGSPDVPGVDQRTLETLADYPFTTGNRVRLLVDGDATFEALFAALDRAERYALVQFYIIHDDRIGQDFHAALVRAAGRGVKVRLLYDEIGSIKLPKAYVRALEDAGVETCGFSDKSRGLRRYRLNFRNHRKMAVVDGREALMGGLNVGDEYLGRDKKLTPWRDTFVALEGPAVLALQASFAEDWYWASRGALDDLDWTPDPVEGDGQHALVLPSGPVGSMERAALFFAHLVGEARERLWIATPYFVPDELAMGALKLAAMRGVDVRILVPRHSDSKLFEFAPWSYIAESEGAGVELFLHAPGFMHQKVILVDDAAVAIGTANVDNRSFRLNFEVMLLVADKAFAAETAAMLEADLARCTPVELAELKKHSFAFRFMARLVRLLSPIL